MPFTWLESMAVGNEAIDEQHRQLVKAIDALMEACKSNKGTDEVENTLVFLVGYIAKHFKAEESIMRKQQYPAYEEHKKIHDDFEQEVAGIVEQFNKEGPTISMVNALEFEVGNWIMEHICKEDKKIGEFLSSEKH